MKREVWKYAIENKLMKKCFMIPAGAKLLHAGVQGKSTCLWFEVDIETKIFCKRSFEVVMTGEHVEHGDYVGTVIYTPYVYHIYETTQGDH